MQWLAFAIIAVLAIVNILVSRRAAYLSRERQAYRRALKEEQALRNAAIEELSEALVITRNSINSWLSEDVLPMKPGWQWHDALRFWNPTLYQAIKDFEEGQRKQAIKDFIWDAVQSDWEDDEPLPEYRNIVKYGRRDVVCPRCEATEITDIHVTTEEPDGTVQSYSAYECLICGAWLDLDTHQPMADEDIMPLGRISLDKQRARY